MPPKKAPAKADSKAKAKAVDDKTFGLKNKNKSAKVAKYVQQVKQQVDKAGNPKSMKETEDRKASLASKKAAEEAKKAELAELFKPVQQIQKIPFGVDPKTIVCTFFKAGQCQKGAKCKFSHDLSVERKDAKIDVYTDARDEDKLKDTMDSWDTEKLESVVKKKHSEPSNKPTDIVCKFFLEAIESRKYGWFWECPNGGKQCKYRHALPPGYVLKKKETEEERRLREENEKENEISLEQFLDEERHKLGSNTTPVTLESFTKWKAERKAKQEAELSAASKKKQDAYKQMRSGLKTGMTFSGRELFTFNPELAVEDDEDGEGAMEAYVREEEEERPPGEEEEARPLYDANADDDESEAEEDNPEGEAGPSQPRKSSSGPDVNEDLFDEDLEGLDGDDDDDD